MNGKQLKNSILQWAIQGKLVPQDPNDEPASVLLERIRAEKKRLIKEGKIKKDKNESIIYRGDDNSYYEKFADGTVKCIDEEIPYELPQGWCWARFSQLYWQLTDGAHLTPKYTERGVPFISVKDMSNGQLSFSNTKYISEEEHRILSTRCNPQKGDLLLSKVGTTGVPAIVKTDKPFSLFVSVALIKFFPELLNSNFLVLLINSPLVQEQARENTRGVGNKNWVLSAISSTLMAIPPIKEQERIVKAIELLNPFLSQYETSQDRLNTLNNGIREKIQKSILQEAIQGRLVPQVKEEEPVDNLLKKVKDEKAKLLKEGKIRKKDIVDSVIFRGEDNKYYEKVGGKTLDITDDIPFDIPSSWVWVRLSTIANLYTGNSISETEKKARYTGEEGKEYIGTKDVGFDSTVCYKNGVAIPEKYISDFKIAREGTVLMCIEGGSAGRKVAILDRDVCFGNKLCCFYPFGSYAKYIYYYIQSPSFSEVFQKNKTGIIGGVSVNTLKELLVAFPPKQEQERICRMIDNVFATL